MTGTCCYVWAETKHRLSVIDQYIVVEGPIRLSGPLPLTSLQVMREIISHHSSLYWGWADRGLWSWFLCSFPVNGERQRVVMALQSAPAADTQIAEVIIYNQRAQKNLLTLKCHFLSVSFCDWACSPWLWPNNWWHLQ